MRKGMTLEFKVTQQEITRLDSQKVYERTKGYLYAHFVFSDDWEGYLKTVKFSNLLDNSYIGITLASDNTCMVPYTLVLYPGVTFCIEGTSHGDIITTNDFIFDVDESNSTTIGVDQPIYEIDSKTLDYEKNGITATLNVKSEVVNTLEITSEDITIDGDKIVFNSGIAKEIMSMNKRLRVDSSIIDNSFSQGEFIEVLTPRAIKDYFIEENRLEYEYSTTNWLDYKYCTTYVEFVFDKDTEQLYLRSNNPVTMEDHIVGFDRWNDTIRLTSDMERASSTINSLRINGLSTVSTERQPSLLFEDNGKDELESVEFKKDDHSSYFKYTVPKGAKQYVVSKLPTQNIDKNGNYFVLTESEDSREYSPTDISNLSTTEYPLHTPGALRQDAEVNKDWFKLNTYHIPSGYYVGEIAIRFNIPCEVTVSVNPRQTESASMYINVNGVDAKLVGAGATGTYTGVFDIDETLCVRGTSSSTNQFYYKLAIQPYTIDGKIPLSTKVDEYINFENLWFKNGGSSGSGGKEYFHCIRYYTDDNNQAYINIKNNSSEPFTIVSLCTFLENLGCTYFTKLFVCSGMAQFNGVTETIIGCYRQGVNALRVKTANNNETNFVYIEDTVTEV